jgi:hypothetical protein
MQRDDTMADSTLQVGAATSNITPRLGISINGNMGDGTARHIHDELHARCLVLDDGGERVALVVCDSCMIPAEVLDAAKDLAHGHTGLATDRIMISATHTHSAATVAGVFQSDPDEEYQEFLALRIADGIRRAVNNLAPARIAWGAGQEPTQVFNRRWRKKPGTIPADPFGGLADRVQMNPPRASDDLVEPAGPTDPEVAFLSVIAADGRPLAFMANYSLHYVGDVVAGHISADYFALFADRMQQLLVADRLDPPFVGVMSNGTSANINNVNFRVAGSATPPYSRMKAVAYTVADAAFQAAQGLQYRDSAPLAMRQARVRLGRRVPRSDEVDRARFVLSQAPAGPLTTLEQIYARETLLLADLPAELETVVQAIRIGELAIATLPCEVFVETGLAIKAESPFERTFTVSLANDYCGYLPTLEHHALGGYETWRARSSFLEAEAEPKLRGRLLALLAELSTTG